MKKLINKITQRLSINYCSGIREEGFMILFLPTFGVHRYIKGGGNNQIVYSNELFLAWLWMEFDLIYISYEKHNKQYRK